MHYFALACDYDGTIASAGRVAEETVAALRKLSASRRRLVLVTGRELGDLKSAFSELAIFDWVVAENGALLYQPSTGEEIATAEPIREDFARLLQRRKVEPLSIGRVIVSTREPHETEVLKAIRDLGLELQVIFNKGAVMVLPSGVNKASGLREALKRLDLSPHNVAGVGDAENDHAFLGICEFSVAVANALPLVKEAADWVTQGPSGAGVRELIAQLLKADLRSHDRRIKRHDFILGKDGRGRDVAVPPFGVNLLFVGASGGGKSTLAKTFLERLVDTKYQFCVIDPEGDFEDFEDGVVLGDRSRVPTNNEVVQLLKDPAQNAVVNLLGVPLDQRPAFFGSLLADLLDMRSRTGRPHWIIVDESHHVLPKEEEGAVAPPRELENAVFITVEPQAMRKEALELVDTVFAVGEAGRSIAAFARAIGVEPPAVPRKRLELGEALFWHRGRKARVFKVAPTRFQHRRHRRKYAEGDLGPELSFYFRGPEGKLNLKAQNLLIFAQLAEGLDDETWRFHLERADYSRWFRDVIKDPELADDAARVEADRRLSPPEARKWIREAIAHRYTLPAEPEVVATV